MTCLNPPHVLLALAGIMSLGPMTPLLALAQGAVTQPPAASQTGAASLSVRVTDQSTAEPVGGASVAIPDLNLSAVTGLDGDVVVTGIAPGDHRVRVTMLGYGEASVTVSLVAGSVARIEVPLTDQPIELAGIVVSYRPAEGWSPRLERAGFYRRQEFSDGRHIDRAYIEERQALQASDVFRGISGVRLVQVGPGRYAAEGRGGFAGFDRRPPGFDNSPIAECRMQVFLDGLFWSEYGMIDDLPIEQVEGFEVYTGLGSIPAEYNRGPSAACGVVLVWSRQ
jgi:hypothetical protein